MAQTKGVPGWLIHEYRKHQKAEAQKVIEFRSKVDTAIKLAAWRTKQRVPQRASSWTPWIERMRRLWREQGYDGQMITQMLRENLNRQLRVAATRGEAAMVYHRQRQDGGYL